MLNKPLDDGDERIIQIIPSDHLWAFYAYEDGTTSKNPINFLALVETSLGDTFVHPCEIDADGYSIEDIRETENFIGIEDDRMPPGTYDWTEKISKFMEKHKKNA